MQPGHRNLLRLVKLNLRVHISSQNDYGEFRGDTRSIQGPKGFSIPTLYFVQKVIPQDIRPGTLSSWLKQLICYKQADQQSLDLVQVKAHDIRAFVASKAFLVGFSVDQIMQASHWKAHNTFTNFTFKTLLCQITTTYVYL